MPTTSLKPPKTNVWKRSRKSCAFVATCRRMFWNPPPQLVGNLSAQLVIVPDDAQEALAKKFDG